MKTKPAQYRLIVADSESSADLLYATSFFAPDAFAYLETPGGTRMLVNDLEIDRARRTARVDAVDSLSEWSARVASSRRKNVSVSSGYASTLAVWLSHWKARRLEVPEAFPLGLAEHLRQAGITLLPAGKCFFPQREIKTSSEIRKISHALRVTEAGMSRAEEVLRASRARKDGKLMFGQSVLTSELLRGEIDSAIVRLGGLPRDTIVAGGRQACDPHERGSGPLKAGELIIVDIFPRIAATGYYGDLTRTFLKGRASEAQRRLWNICLKGQKMALKQMSVGASGIEIHQRVQNWFTEEGYPTRIHNGRWEGFFHGTGHSLGLEIHEEPRFARAIFTPGQVFTVEPGLYIPEIGGVRHEDVVIIGSKKQRLLSRHPKPFEI
jgi:Xaa-Pro aminopeptidase